jgi:hypothetical protein
MYVYIEAFGYKMVQERKEYLRFSISEEVRRRIGGIVRIKRGFGDWMLRRISSGCNSRRSHGREIVDLNSVQARNGMVVET